MIVAIIEVGIWYQEAQNKFQSRRDKTLRHLHSVIILVIVYIYTLCSLSFPVRD